MSNNNRNFMFPFPSFPSLASFYPPPFLSPFFFVDIFGSPIIFLSFPLFFFLQSPYIFLTPHITHHSFPSLSFSLFLQCGCSTGCVSACGSSCCNLPTAIKCRPPLQYNKMYHLPNSNCCQKTKYCNVLNVGQYQPKGCCTGCTTSCATTNCGIPTPCLKNCLTPGWNCTCTRYYQPKCC